MNSIVAIIPLGDDVFGLPYIDEKGMRATRIVRLSIGDILLMNTNTYHFGCSHEDFDGSKRAAHRRHLFMYLDIGHRGAKDELGQVVNETEVGMPSDYELYFEDNMPSMKAAFHAMTSELSWLQYSVTVSRLNDIEYKGRYLNETIMPTKLAC